MTKTITTPTLKLARAWYVFIVRARAHEHARLAVERTLLNVKAHERANWKTRNPNKLNRQGERRDEGSEGTDARAKKGRMKLSPDPMQVKSRQRE